MPNDKDLDQIGIELLLYGECVVTEKETGLQMHLSYKNGKLESQLIPPPGS